MNIINELISKNIIKFGQFTLKNGDSSPIYFDFRVLISYPQLLNDITDKLISKMSFNGNTFVGEYNNDNEGDIL